MVKPMKKSRTRKIRAQTTAEQQRTILELRVRGRSNVDAWKETETRESRPPPFPILCRVVPCPPPGLPHVSSQWHWPQQSWKRHADHDFSSKQRCRTIQCRSCCCRWHRCRRSLLPWSPPRQRTYFSIGLLRPHRPVGRLYWRILKWSCPLDSLCVRVKFLILICLRKRASIISVGLRLFRTVFVLAISLSNPMYCEDLNVTTRRNTISKDFF